jgi:hypothetical protein
VAQTIERRLGQLAHDWGRAPRVEYAYVLGMYLGDGCITHLPRTDVLRITLDSAYPGIIAECRDAVATLMPRNKVSIIERPCNAVDVAPWSQLWQELFPQHGRGAKHLRPIRLELWQRRVVAAEPHAFIRGLIHSDSSYFLNPVRSKQGTLYVYDRYVFYNSRKTSRRCFGGRATSSTWRRATSGHVPSPSPSAHLLPA